MIKDNKLNNFMKAALRKYWQRCEAYQNLIRSAKVEGKYHCSNCTKHILRKDVYIEHIVPLSTRAYDSWESYWYALSDLSNVAVWGKQCCKREKDKQDRVKKKKTNLKPTRTR